MAIYSFFLQYWRRIIRDLTLRLEVQKKEVVTAPFSTISSHRPVIYTKILHNYCFCIQAQVDDQKKPTSSRRTCWKPADDSAPWLEYMHVPYGDSLARQTIQGRGRPTVIHRRDDHNKGEWLSINFILHETLPTWHLEANLLKRKYGGSSSLAASHVWCPLISLISTTL